jgi:uncharacterized protein
VAAVTVRVTPRAGRSAVTGLADGMLHVKLAAPPVEGAANDALVDLLAALLRVGRRSIRLTSGLHGRVKRVEISGMDQAALDQRLAPFRDDAAKAAMLDG